MDVGASNPNVKNTERIGQDATIGKSCSLLPIALTLS